MSNFNEFSKEVFEANKLKGFDVSKNNIGQTLMLIVSELAEALEADRKNKHAKRLDFNLLQNINQANHTIGNDDFDTESFESLIKDSFEDEIADAAIRIFDLAGGLNIDLDWHIAQKRKYNALRPHMHNKAY